VWTVEGKTLVKQTMEMTTLCQLENLSVDLILIRPDAKKEPVLHRECDEFLYILEGSLDILINGKIQRYDAGCYCQLPKGTVHGSINRSGKDVKMLAICSPAYKREYEHSAKEEGIDYEL
jgi:mannose-6-phosphate isomerase-like protein (cupin superfamily)